MHLNLLNKGVNTSTEHMLRRWWWFSCNELWRASGLPSIWMSLFQEERMLWSNIHPMFTLNAVIHMELTCMLPFLDRRHGFVKLNFEGSKYFSVSKPRVILQKVRGWFKLKYRQYHCANEMMLRRSYLYNGISFTDKMVSSYKILAQAIIAPIIIQFPYINQGVYRKKLMQMI